LSFPDVKTIPLDLLPHVNICALALMLTFFFAYLASKNNCIMPVIFNFKMQYDENLDLLND
jgi:hypothetical protein